MSQENPQLWGASETAALVSLYLGKPVPLIGKGQARTQDLAPCWALSHLSHWPQQPESSLRRCKEVT